MGQMQEKRSRRLPTTAIACASVWGERIGARLGLIVGP